MIDFKWRTFLAVIEEGTLAKAGERLGLTQPAVSQHLKSLDEHYGQDLFDHKGRRLVLNEAGKIVRSVAEQSLLAEKKLQKRLTSFLDGRSSYNLGATLTIGEFILPTFLGQYYQSFPDRDLTIRIRNTISILDQLRKGLIDLAIVEGPFDKESVHSHHFMQDEMVFIAAEERMTGCGELVGLEELQKGRLILREKGSGTRFHWEEYRKRNRISLPESAVIMEVGSLSAIKSLVEAGYGCSIMSRKAIEKELILNTLQTRPFAWGPLMRDLNFVYTENSPTSFVEEFIRFCRESQSTREEIL
jgi:LysR family transcriptional regulator, transcriptional activator of the cysJI operon